MREKIEIFWKKKERKKSKYEKACKIFKIKNAWKFYRLYKISENYESNCYNANKNLDEKRK